MAFKLLVTLHLLAAIVWAGGIAFLALVGAPALRGLDDAALRQRLFDALGRRFRTVGWSAVTVSVVTGLFLLHARGWLDPAVLGSAAFWGTGAGVALTLKLVALAAMFAINGWHDFVDGPRASAATAGTPDALRLRRRAMVLARVGAVAALAVLVAGVWVARS